MLSTSVAAVSAILGGEGGIRTHGELAPTAVFKTAALNHSATSPQGQCLSRVGTGRARRTVNHAGRDTVVRNSLGCWEDVL